jgi:hypothetical protein
VQFSGAKVANRNAKVWHGGDREWSLNDGQIPKALVVREHVECGLQSWRGESAGVARRPRERPPTRNPSRHDSQLPHRCYGGAREVRLRRQCCAAAAFTRHAPACPAPPAPPAAAVDVVLGAAAGGLEGGGVMDTERGRGARRSDPPPEELCRMRTVPGNPLPRRKLRRAHPASSQRHPASS